MATSHTGIRLTCTYHTGELVLKSASKNADVQAQKTVPNTAGTNTAERGHGMAAVQAAASTIAPLILLQTVHQTGVVESFDC